MTWNPIHCPQCGGKGYFEVGPIKVACDHKVANPDCPTCHGKGYSEIMPGLKIECGCKQVCAHEFIHEDGLCAICTQTERKGNHVQR